MKFFLFFIIFIWISSVIAREGSEVVTVPPGKIKLFQKFGFFTGGEAIINATTGSSFDLKLYGCTEEASKKLILDYVHPGLCTGQILNETGCNEQDIYYSGDLEFTVTAKRRSAIYFFTLLNCENQPITATLDYSFLNPGNQQLSSEYVPLPIMYAVYFVVWIPLTMFWIANWIKHRQQKNKLHKIITLFPLSKLLWEAISCTFWYLGSRYPYIEQSVVASYEILRILCQTLLILVFLLIARGWGILGVSMGKDSIIIAGMVIIFLASNIVGIIIGGVTELLILGSYSLIVFSIFFFVSKSLNKLELQRNDPSVNVVGMHLRGVNIFDKKKKMFSNFTKIMILFCIAEVIILGLETLVFYNAIWAANLLFEFTDLIMFMAIAIVFRLRRDNIYYKLEGAGGSLEKIPIVDQEMYWAAVESSDEIGRNNPHNKQLKPGLAAIQ